MSGLVARLSSVLDRRWLWVAGALVAAGAALRLAWLFSVPSRLPPIPSEMYNAAVNFARNGTIANVYQPDSGPTAHVNPVWTVLIGSLYRLFGLNLTTEYVLIGLALVVVLGLFLMLDRAFRALGSPPIARLGALAVACLLPLSFSNETRAFRVWENAGAGLIAAAFLLACVRLDRVQAEGRPVGWRALTLLAAAGAVMFMISPTLALGLFGCLGLLALRTAGVGRFVGVTLVSAVLVAAVTAPWALRNARELGAPVLTRSNFWLEASLAFHPGRIGDRDPRATFLARLEAIHPYESRAAFERLRAAGGEVAYMASLGRETKAWMAAHPGETVRLAAGNLAALYFPPRWTWEVYGDGARGVPVRQAIVWPIAALGLVGLALRLLARDGRYLYVAALLLLSTLPYAMTVPVHRYGYVPGLILLFLAADLVGRTIGRLAGARAYA